MICPGCGKRVPDDGFALYAECDAKRGISHERHTEEAVDDILAEIRGEIGDMYDGTIIMHIEKLHGYAARIEEACRREAESIERIVRDAIIDYQEMYPHAPNDEAERDLIDRANRGNDRIR